MMFILFTLTFVLLGCVEGVPPPVWPNKFVATRLFLDGTVGSNSSNPVSLENFGTIFYDWSVPAMLLGNSRCIVPTGHACNVIMSAQGAFALGAGIPRGCCYIGNYGPINPGYAINATYVGVKMFFGEESHAWTFGGSTYFHKVSTPTIPWGDAALSPGGNTDVFANLIVMEHIAASTFAVPPNCKATACGSDLLGLRDGEAPQFGVRL